jgi:hypothetical protein
MPPIGEYQLAQLATAINHSQNSIQAQNAATTNLRSLITTLAKRISSHRGHTTRRTRKTMEIKQRQKMTAMFTNKLMTAVHNPVTQAAVGAGEGPGALVAARNNKINQLARQVVADARSHCRIQEPLKNLVIMAWVNEDLLSIDDAYFTAEVRNGILH